ncbi:hypothetical protein F2P81_005307 [Scophthalmus maximus]|uniref:Sushi domain-containing protein n=1 Tax=Scophthalmus maximus TaxID=52904 RepID=A0A6A4T997_SCOMX|nr:hypothetical protein F2P81_005307 [Scophthalmus maximus]
MIRRPQEGESQCVEVGAVDCGCCTSTVKGEGMSCTIGDIHTKPLTRALVTGSLRASADDSDCGMQEIRVSVSGFYFCLAVLGNEEKMHLITGSCVLFLWIRALTSEKIADCTLDQFVKGPLYDSNFDTTDLEASYPAGKQLRDAQFEFGDISMIFDFLTCFSYQMVSRTNYRRCMAGGWDGVVPVCEAQQCPVIHVSNNVQVVGDPEEASYGNVVQFSCKSSSEVLIGSQEVYCNEFGEWSGEAPKCKAINCLVPVIENGYVPGNIQEYKEHEILHFVCDWGFKPTQGRPSKCTKLGIRAEWSPTPDCELIKCKLSIPRLEGTRYEPANRNVFSVGDTIRVRCGERYWISDPRQTSAQTTCKDDGEWTVEPVCKEVTCINRRDSRVNRWSVYWGQRLTQGVTVSYTCYPGYKRTNDATTATCTRDGWSPDPLCEEITCDRREIQNTVIVNHKDKYHHNEKANYVCNNGYKGSFHLNCRENGWNGYSQCTEITCDRREIQNTVIVNHKDKYHHNEKANYVCNNGYKGSFHLNCRENGWNGYSQCTEITCDRREIQNTVIVNHKDKYHHNEKANYVCNNGYKGSFHLNCREDGWIGHSQCTEITCDRREIQNTVIVNHKDKYRYNEKANYVCNNGYEGSFHLNCREDGWIGHSQCTVKSCEKHDISNAYILRNEKKSYRHHERVQYACRTGDERRFTVVCDRGVWTGIQSCTDCPRAEVPHGFAVGPYGGKLYYTCHDGYKLATKGWWGEATCIGTVWSGLDLCIANSSCGRVPLIPNSKMISLHNYGEGKSVQIICQGGYTAQVDRFTCMEGNWDTNGLSLDSICTPTVGHCSPPPKVVNAIVVTVYQSEYLSGSEVTYQCRYNYTMEGQATIKCDDGNWQQRNITCTRTYIVHFTKSVSKSFTPPLKASHVAGWGYEYLGDKFN